MSPDLQLWLSLSLTYVCKLCVSQYIERPVFVNESDLIPRVVSGTKAKLGDVPYQVALMQKIPRKKTYTSFCGGTILTETKVLSAGHCFVDSRSSQSTCNEAVEIKESELKSKAVAAGVLDSRGHYGKEGQWRKVRKVVYPTSLIVTAYEIVDDIAVLMVKKPFKFTAEVNKIGIARRKSDDYRGKCLISGYGQLRRTSNPTAEDVSSHLQTAEITLLTNYYCTKMFQSNMKGYICSNGQAVGVAEGDSGGPLVCSGTQEAEEGPNGVLVGVTAAYVPGKTDLYTRVALLASFIDHNEATSYYSVNTSSNILVLTLISTLHS